jgi:hypothetical protein
MASGHISRNFQSLAVAGWLAAAAAQGVPASPQPQTTSKPSAEDVYNFTPEQISRIEKVMEGEKNVLFISGGNIIVSQAQREERARKEEERGVSLGLSLQEIQRNLLYLEEYILSGEIEALKREIRNAASEQGWTKEKADQFISTLEKPGDRFNTYLEYSLAKMRRALSSGGPNAFPIPAAVEEQGHLGSACIVFMPSDLDNRWIVEKNFFEILTGLKNPEVPFPGSAEMTLAYVLGHEVKHCGDPNAAKQLEATLQANSLVKDDPVEALKLEITADEKIEEKHLQVYKDPSFFKAVLHARAMAGVVLRVSNSSDLTHITSFELERGLADYPREKETHPHLHLSAEQIIEGGQAIDKFLTDRCGNDPVNCLASYKELEPETLYATILQGLASQDISGSSAIEIARGYTEGFEYFMPKEAAEIRKAMGVEIVQQDNAVHPSKEPFLKKAVHGLRRVFRP